MEIRRARVAGQHKVTKTQRSTRKIKLLAPALRALKDQTRFTREFGHKSGKREKTHWITFMKRPASA